LYECAHCGSEIAGSALKGHTYRAILPENRYMPTSTVLVVLEALKGEKVLDGMRGWPIAFGQGATTETMLFNSAV